MVADREHLRFYVDESALGLGKALAIARTDTIHVGHALVPKCPVGTLDVDWMPAIADRGLIAIGRDRRMRTRPAEIQLIKETGLRVFRIGGKRDETTWGRLTWLVRRWDDIEEVVSTRGPGPWWYVITERAVRELLLP